MEKKEKVKLEKFLDTYFKEIYMRPFPVLIIPKKENGLGFTTYQIGAYQVMGKYLKDRRGRKLSLNEINHYMKVAKAILLTIELQKRLTRSPPTLTPFEGEGEDIIPRGLR
jgi:hypothetical protein